MKNILSYFVLSILSFFVTISVSSCKEDNIDTKNETVDEKEAVEIVNSATIEWGNSFEKVKKHMNGYYVISEQNNDFIMFSNKKKTQFISYKFNNNSLYSTLILMPKMEDESDIEKVLNEYNYIGELEETQIFQSITKNCIACTYEATKDNVSYQAFGFTPINSESIESLPSVTITTGDADEIKYNSATLSGHINGTNSKVTVGVYYDTNKDLPSSSRKTKTTTSKDEFSFHITGLKEQTTYYYQMYAIVDKIYYYGETMSFTTEVDTKYKIGDLYPNSQNPIGVVFYASSTGRKGKIVSFDYCENLAWDNNGENSESASCSSTTDGSNNKMPEESPVAKWVASHGEDWYCPSRKELITLNTNLSSVNETLSTMGYKIHQGLYWSSSQATKTKAYFVCVSPSSYEGYNSGKYGNAVKDDSGKRCCAIKKF